MRQFSRLYAYALLIPISAYLLFHLPVSFDSGPILYLPFNSTIKDESSYKNQIIQHGGILAEDRYGKKDQCLEFDGFNDYLEIRDNQGLFSQKKMTFSFWFNTTSSNIQNIIGKENFITAEGAVYQLFINWSNYPGIGFNLVEEKEDCYSVRSLNSSYVHSNKEVHTFTWYFVTATWDGKEQRLFVNGKLIAERKPDFTIVRSCKTPVRIGIWYQNSLPFKGKLDDIRIYKRVLSDNQIRKLSKL